MSCKPLHPAGTARSAPDLIVDDGGPALFSAGRTHSDPIKSRIPDAKGVGQGCMGRISQSHRFRFLAC